MVTAQYLLKGTVYALEQSGILLRDAVMLYKNKAFSSAIVLAAFAREELGRSHILRKKRKEIVENGKSVTLKEIKDACEDHVKKQEWAQLSTVQRASGNGRLAKLLKTRMRYHPQSEEYKEANKQLNEITDQQKKRTPKDRHMVRLRALYVEPNDSGTDWNKPQEKSQDEARVFLVDAVNDYAGEYDRIQNGAIQLTDSELFQALQEWAERPKLPLPEWP